MQEVSKRWRLWAVAIFCFIACALLGMLVSSRPPFGLDVSVAAWSGSATPLALFFTALGRWYVLLPTAVCIAGFIAISHRDAIAVAALFGSQILGQGANAVVKLAFDRARPANPILPEHDFSYPSGHAVTAVVFYAGLALLFARMRPLPRPLSTFGIAGLIVAVAGIPWSRVALGAHYATDVIGGLLFGTGWLSATFALYYQFLRRSRYSA